MVTLHTDFRVQRVEFRFAPSELDGSSVVVFQMLRIMESSRTTELRNQMTNRSVVPYPNEASESRNPNERFGRRR
jgi:hypothetical protein